MEMMSTFGHGFWSEYDLGTDEDNINLQRPFSEDEIKCYEFLLPWARWTFLFVLPKKLRCDQT